MSKRFNIKPPTWPKEYTFQEFVKLNPHIINENQLITLYNQYLNKYLTELGEKKIHFKQSKINQLLTELKESQLHEIININAGGGGGRNYALQFTGVDSANARADLVATQFNPNDPTGVGYSSSDRKPLGESGFTISYWVRPDEAYTDSFHIGWKENTNARFEFGFKNSAKPYFSVGGNQMSNVSWATLFTDSGNSDMADKVLNLATYDLLLGNWYHIVVSYEGTDAPNNEMYRRVYFNGRQIRGYNSEAIGTDYNDYFNVDHDGDFDWTRTGGSMTQGLSFGVRAVIGTGTHTDGLRNTKYNNGHACALDEVAIYNEVKDNDWVRAVYDGKTSYNHSGGSGLMAYWRFNEGSGTTVKDLGPYGYHGTLTNASYGTTIDTAINNLPPTGTPTWIIPPNNYGQ